MRSAIYARRSTEEQQSSLERQVEECRSYAAREGMEVVAVFEDSASGWKTDAKDRPGFRRMIGAADEGQFDTLIVWEVSRLSRQGKRRSALAIVWDLEDMGVRVRSVIDPTTGDDFADDLVLYVKGKAAEAESRTKAERVRSGKRRAVVEHGVLQSYRAPFGYRKAAKIPSPTKSDRSIHSYEKDPKHAQVALDIFDRYLKGQSPQQIANWLNGRGIEPPASPEHRHAMKRRGKREWHQSSLRSYLANPLLAGFATYRGKRIKRCQCATLDEPDGWTGCEHDWVRAFNVPPIIDEAVWERAQEMLDRRRRHQRGGRGNHTGPTVFLLSGLLWCEECGERIGTRSAQRPGMDHRYICRGRRMGKCSLPPIPQHLADEAVRESFVRQFVEVIDVQATLESLRTRLMVQLDSQAKFVRDEMTEVERERSAAAEFQARVKADYKDRAMTREQWADLDAECRTTVERCDAALENLTVRLAQVEHMPTQHIDRALDRITVLRGMLGPDIAGASVVELAERLRDVVEEFRVARAGSRIIFEPKLKEVWEPEGDWRTLDFGDRDAEGQLSVEVVEHFDAVMRKIDLTREFAGDKLTGSW